MTDIYVWVYTPSAVRDGYQIGAYAKARDWRFTADLPNFDADDAAERVWRAVKAIEPNPTFHAAAALDAPLSAALCEALSAMAQGEKA